MLTDQELERYSRQLLLPEVDIDGQTAYRAAHVMIVGAGGLGNPAALYLAAAGIGRLTLVDDDQVELSNLARQIGFRDAQLGQAKAKSLADSIAAINPHCQVDVCQARVTDGLAGMLDDVDLVLDCCDNFATRYAINRACVASKKPLVSGAAIRLSGQVAAFDLSLTGRACYRCVFADTGEAELRCSEAGVLGPLVGMIGSFQALLGLRYLVSGELPNCLWHFDGRRFQWRQVFLRKDPACPECG